MPSASIKVKGIMKQGKNVLKTSFGQSKIILNKLPQEAEIMGYVVALLHLPEHGNAQIRD